MASYISLDQQQKLLKLKEMTLNNQIVFEYFNNLPEAERDEKLMKAIYIGVLALMEDRLSAFLSRTQNELGTELENLKRIFDLKQEQFFRTTAKGVIAEEDIAAYLEEYFKNSKLSDTVELTGNTAGVIKNNKTGDLVCKVNGNHDLKIVIESKFDKSIALGDIQDKDVFIKKAETAWNQLIEAKANREGKVSIIVFDRSLASTSICKACESVAFVQGVGLICLIDSQRGDYTNLVIAYLLARDIVLHAKETEIDYKTLEIIIKRIIKTIQSFINIKSLVENNIQNSKKILEEIEKSRLLLEFNEKYLQKFLHDGKLSDTDMLAFYNGEEIKEEYKLIEREIKEV